MPDLITTRLRHPSRPMTETRPSIRIAYVIPTLDQSGAERQLALLATQLPTPEFQPHVIALNRGGYYEEQIRRHGVSVDILQKRFRFDPLTYIRLRRRLRQLQPDIVQSFLFSANTYARLPGICPASAAIVVSERCVDSWKSTWQLKIDRWLNNRMQAMTANSESVATFYRANAAVSSDRIRVIANGIPTAPEQSSSTVSLRAELKLPVDAKLVGFVGRFAKQKCLTDLMWAFQLLHQVIDNVFLILVGDGPERDDLAALARSFDCRDKVFFTGHRADAVELMAQFNVFCLPSSFEGMSNSLMEAMACRVPVVVSDIPANLELVVHEQNGLVVPLGQGPELTRACQRILTDSVFAEQLGTAAKTTMQTKHSVERMVQQHAQLYRELKS
ncbi:MAG: glycosyltransferase [Planctomycetaceae bacterium]